jgi:7-cyano-7-deazaguanine reductase
MISLWDSIPITNEFTEDSIMSIHHSPLGKEVEYGGSYSPALLFPIARAEKRLELGIHNQPCFYGCDIWNAYEFSWLDPQGKPHIAIAEFSFPFDSENIIESKAFKLYLNSFNQTVFTDIATVQKTLENDLSTATKSPVTVTLISPQQFSQMTIQEFTGICLDDLPVACNVYQPDPDLLKLGSTHVTEKLYSYLLKSNCPITGQPDWGCVAFHYQGRQIQHASLLQYIVSFRLHNDFHEHCVERMYRDIMQYCQPEKLTVYARYTRRGGLDINPFRTNFEVMPVNQRQARQ